MRHEMWNTVVTGTIFAVLLIIWQLPCQGESCVFFLRYRPSIG